MHEYTICTLATTKAIFSTVSHSCENSTLQLIFGQKSVSIFSHREKVNFSIYECTFKKVAYFKCSIGAGVKESNINYCYLAPSLKFVFDNFQVLFAVKALD